MPAAVSRIRCIGNGKLFKILTEFSVPLHRVSLVPTLPLSWYVCLVLGQSRLALLLAAQCVGPFRTAVMIYGYGVGFNVLRVLYGHGAPAFTL